MTTYATLHYFEANTRLTNAQLREMRDEQERRRDEKRRVLAFLNAMARLYGTDLPNAA